MTAMSDSAHLNRAQATSPSVPTRSTGAMTAVEVTALMEDRAKVEIEVTAVVPD